MYSSFKSSYPYEPKPNVSTEEERQNNYEKKLADHDEELKKSSSILIEEFEEFKEFKEFKESLDNSIYDLWNDFEIYSNLKNIKTILFYGGREINLYLFEKLKDKNDAHSLSLKGYLGAFSYWHIPECSGQEKVFLKKAIEMKNGFACCVMGMIYEFGIKGKKSNYEKAKYFYKKAIVYKDIESLLRLSSFCDDNKKALDLLLRFYKEDQDSEDCFSRINSILGDKNTLKYLLDKIKE